MSRTARWVTVSYMAFSAVFLVVLLRLPEPYPLVLTAGAGVLVAAFALPLPVVVAGWGALLPIWSFGPLPPVVFDVARLGLGAIIAGRAWASGVEPNRAIKRWATLLTVLAAVCIPLSWWHGEGVATGLFLLISAVLVWVALWRLPSMWPLWFGFATGATVSGLVIVISATGLTDVGFLVPNANPGIERYTGLGTSAPRVSVELAAAAVIWWVALSGRVCRSRLVALGGLAVSVAGLLLCGGRTGLAGLCVAGVVMVARRWIRPAAAVAMGAVVAAAFYVVGSSVQFNTLTRLTGAGPYQNSGFSTGRIRLLVDSWQTYLTSPILGPGETPFTSTHGELPHFAPMAFGLRGGLVAAVIVVALTVMLVRLAFRRNSGDPLARCGALVAAVLVGPALLEPDGAWVGVEMLSLLFAAVVSVRLLRHPADVAGAGLLDVQARPRTTIRPLVDRPDWRVHHALR